MGSAKFRALITAIKTAINSIYTPRKTTVEKKDDKIKDNSNNFNRSTVALDLLNKTAEEENVDITIVSDLNKCMTRKQPWITDDRTDVAVRVFGQCFRCLKLVEWHRKWFCAGIKLQKSFWECDSQEVLFFVKHRANGL